MSLYDTGIRPAAEYRAWKAMRWRCNPKNLACKKNYYDRGIRVCGRWDNFDTFLADMGQRPGSDHSLDRVDNDKGYSPDNCRWATRIEQTNNTSRTNYVAGADGARVNLMQISRETGMPPETIRYRIKSGWSIERIFSSPLNPATRRRSSNGKFI